MSAAPFALSVRLTIKPEHADEFAAGLTQAAEFTAATPGNLSFAAGRSLEQPNVMVLFERWASKAEYDAFHATPVMRERMASYPDLLLQPPEVTVMRGLT